MKASTGSRRAPRRLLAAAAASALLAGATGALAHGGDTPGRMGPMGPGMMGPGMMGPGMMGPAGPGAAGRAPASPCAPAVPGGGMPGPGMGMMGPGMGMMGPGMGMMGPGMMGGMMMGPGMMGRGWGWTMPGWGGAPAWRGGWDGCPGRVTPSRPLDAGDVKAWLERWLAMHGNPRITVGRVEEKDEDTIVAELVTREGGVVVDKFEIDRRTGRWRRVPD